MKILVLGGTQFVGIHLVNQLIKNGHDITIATRGITPDHFGEKVKRLIIERKNADSLSQALNHTFYDVVIDNNAYCSNDVRILLDVLKTNKYIMTSTVSVYRDFRLNMQETELNAADIPLKWCGRDDYPYDEIKRQAEAALFQAYPDVPAVAVRFPWIFGIDDYTKRLYFYVEHIVSGQALHIDNYDARLSFINSQQAGDFLAWCAEAPIDGCVNACSNGTASLKEIIAYAEKHSGKKAIVHEAGEAAPLNGVPSFSLDTKKAQAMGYHFQNIEEWLYPAIDYWIQGH